MIGEYALIALLFVIGMIIAIGKVLASDEKTSMKVIVGKAILNGCTSLMAGMLLLTLTSASPLVIVGFGAFLGTLGTEASIAWIKSKFGG
mgnify:CR=1 FL=1